MQYVNFENVIAAWVLANVSFRWNKMEKLTKNALSNNWPNNLDIKIIEISTPMFISYLYRIQYTNEHIYSAGERHFLQLTLFVNQGLVLSKQCYHWTLICLQTLSAYKQSRSFDFIYDIFSLDNSLFLSLLLSFPLPKLSTNVYKHGVKILNRSNNS